MLDELKADLAGGQPHRFSVTIEVEGPSPDRPPALVACAFADAEGTPIEGPVPGMLTSGLYGPYLYVGAPGQSGPLMIDFAITPPPGAAAVTLALHPWRARAVRLIEAMRPAAPAEAAKPAAPAAPADPALLGQLDHAVTPGESYDVLARFAGPFTTRTALAAVRFEAEDGTEIIARDGVLQSDAVGHYRYLEADDRLDLSGPHDPSLALASFTAPPGAARVTVRMLRWTRGQDLQLDSAEIRGQNDPGRCIAAGVADLRLATWFSFAAGLTVDGRRDGKLALLDLVFTDAAGNRLTTTADGLRRTAQYQYVTAILADPLGPGDGCHPLHVAFRPPAGAVRAAWTLRPAAGIAAGAIALAGDPVIRNLRPDLALQLADRPGLPRHHETLDAGQIDILRSRIPAEPVWAGIARQGHEVLAELVLPVTPDGWFLVCGGVSRAAGGLDRADLVLLPVWFDAAGQPLAPETQTGCPASARLGPHRAVTLRPDAEGVTARLHEPFRAPPGAAYAMLHLVACHAAAGIAVTVIESRAVSAEDLFEDLDTTHMTRPQLLQAAEIAELIWDLPARRALYRALGTMEPDGASYAHRAQVLTDQLADLDTGWLPDLAPAPAARTDPDPAAILHLLKVICPEESSGGAVRSSSILQAQAAGGLRPVACLPLAAPHGDLSGHPDGIVACDRDGVSVNFLNFPALEPRDLPPAEVLSLETGLHDRVLRRHRCSLIHAASGFRGYETALKGLALARANDLPLVYEVRSFHEHTWRPISAAHMGHRLTRLREAQENRCMAAADAVVTISRAMEANLQGRGVPADRLFVVPNAIGSSFETLGDLGEVARLRQRHGFAGAVTVGYISNFSAREGHAVLLDAFGELIAAGRDLHLVMVGDGPERDAIARAAEARGLAGRVILPGAVDHAGIRAWYRAIDLFVVPRIADFASDYVTPLKPFEAMSQLVPVIMSDRPVTAEIAGENEERAGVFRSGDPAALAAAIDRALADRAALAARAAAARDWVLRERVWASVVRRYDDVYAAARAEHARRADARRAG